MKTGTIHVGIRLRIVENGECIFGNVAVMIIKNDFGSYTGGFERRSQMVFDELRLREMSP